MLSVSFQSLFSMSERLLRGRNGPTMVREAMAGLRETRRRTVCVNRPRCGSCPPVASASRASMDTPTARTPAPIPVDGGQHVQLGDEYYVLASSLASRRHKHVLAHGDTFA